MNLEQMRKESGIKAYKIAEKLGVSRIQFRNLEKGLYNISDDKVEKLSEVYEKSKAEIEQAIKEAHIDD
ncbi:helix-turn-helix transcriptional regulator [Clostridium sp. C2-6-12]|uniref:helix-turn-helix domain-containing protein n=1 Tax=Clostridium sp. C2-6-12 TaxID=2698832 RepID=UPI00137217C3|nr:helix-turn-helix transcriptional regulator [Clostridium sp. C2-6-12]